MANRRNTGLRPADAKTAKVMRFPITTGNSATIFVGDIASALSTGGIKRSIAGDGAIVVGVIVGLFDTNGIACGAPGSAVTTKYMPASTAGYADIALAVSNTIFIAPAGATALAVTDIWGTVDHVNTAGSTTTAQSGHVLNGSAVNTEGQMQILGLVNEPNNAWGAYCDVFVRFNESIWGQTGSATGV